MKQSRKDRIVGAVREAKGRVAEIAAHVTNDPDKVAEARKEQIAGRIQNTVGKLEDLVGK